jgi:hypothetical protein
MKYQMSRSLPSLQHIVRGAIAHGKKMEKFYTIENLLQGGGPHTVRSIFDEFGGGTKILDSIEVICTELMENGPVVSTSFVL